MQKQTNTLQIKNLQVLVEDKEIVRGVSFVLKSGQLQVIMGPNGSGKSTLTYAIMGHPSYTTSGKVQLNKTELTDKKADERARLGLMLAFQSPLSVPGVTLSNFLRTAYRQVHAEEKISVVDLHHQIEATAEKLHLAKELLRRGINDGFSGGERKKAEMLQLLILRPKFAVFDEIDTGLDVDALKAVAMGIALLQEQGTGILLITHYQRILGYLKPEVVHVMRAGKFFKSGDASLITRIEEKGYAAIFGD